MGLDVAVRVAEVVSRRHGPADPHDRVDLIEQLGLAALLERLAADPRGQILSIGARDQDALVTADLDLDKIREVRNTWQFFRDRRPETYNGIVRL